MLQHAQKQTKQTQPKHHNINENNKQLNRETITQRNQPAPSNKQSIKQTISPTTKQSKEEIINQTIKQQTTQRRNLTLKNICNSRSTAPGGCYVTAVRSHVIVVACLVVKKSSFLIIAS